MSNNKNVKRIVGLLGFLISVGLIWYIFRKIDVKQSWSIVKSTPIATICIMVMVYLSTFFFRTLRWKLMLTKFSDLRFNILFKSVVLGFAGNNLIPARGGELLRMAYFSRNTKISQATSLSSILLEKVIDALVLLALLALTILMLTEVSEFLVNTIRLVSWIFIPVVLGIIVFRVKGEAIIEWLNSKWEGKLQFLTKLLQKIWDALSFLKLDGNTLQIFVLSFLIWLLESVVFMFGLSSMDIYEGSIFVMGIIAMCVVNFGVLIPSSPGYIGVFQAALVIALSSFKIEETKSLAAAILIHSCQFFPITIVGIVVMLFEFFQSKKVAYEQEG